LISDVTSLEVNVAKSISEIKELPSTISQIDLNESDAKVWLVYQWGDRLYTEVNKTLYVYELGDLTSSPATYPLGNRCYSALITDNFLYLGGDHELHIFEVNPSPNEPLRPVTKITTAEGVLKILRVCDELLLG
jgi:hypothetical protein